MLNVGLTGNIASGKSTVVDLFRRWGATIIDADALAREAQAPGGEVLAAIARRFGADVLAGDGSLDRARLRAMRGLGNEEADRMIAAQMPAERKRGRSHYVIDNKGTLEELEADARRLYDVLAARAKQLP